MNINNLRNKNFAILFFCSIFLTSCATIVGGSKYYAHIVVDHKPNAQIIYKGEVIGKGSATVQVKRSNADKFTFSVKEEGCDEQQYKYRSRSFRVAAFAASVIFWTGITPNNILLPWGTIIDLATGAVWKPNIMETGVSKEDLKNFTYLVTYSSCNQKKAEIIKSYIDVVYLKNGIIVRGLITEQIPNVQIKILTNDGSIFIYKMDEIEQILKEISKP